jgi:hypothetical protein
VGLDYVGDTKTLDVHVKRLRAKVEEDPRTRVHILTVRGWATSSRPEGHSGAASEAAGLRPLAQALGLNCSYMPVGASTGTDTNCLPSEVTR